jgi:hypothetical protein
MDDGVDGRDTPAEVDATFRTLRRVAVGYFVVFLVAIVGFPLLAVTLGWWSSSRLVGGMSPGFLMAAFGLYAFFALIGIAAASLSSAVEARMLGGPEPADHLRDDGLDGAPDGPRHDGPSYEAGERR